MKYVVYVDNDKVSGHNISINGQDVSDKVFDEDMVGYVYVDRCDLIVDIQNWLHEARQAGRISDATLMDQDIDYLKTLRDNYVFSSSGTNEYIAQSDNEDKFEEICEEIIEADKSLNQQLVEDAKKVFNKILANEALHIEIEMWPSSASIYNDENKLAANIATYKGYTLQEQFIEIVDFLLHCEPLFVKKSGVVYLAEETDVWFSTNDRNRIGIYTSRELAHLSAMRQYGEVLREEDGGYKSIREGCEVGVYITECLLDELPEQ